MSQSTDTSPLSEGKGVAKPHTKLPTASSSKDQPTPGTSAYGISTINVLSTAISRGKPPADPQTRSDFCFDRLLSFLPHDEHKLLRVYNALDVPSSTLRRWASKGRKRLGEKVVARLEQRQDAAPAEYQFAVDHLYVWGLGNARDVWARAGQDYDRKLKGERSGLREKKKAAKRAAFPGAVAKEAAASSQPSGTSESSTKRKRNAVDDTTNVPKGSKVDVPEFNSQHEISKKKKKKKKKATGNGPSPLGKFSSR
ncbi:hypothetical protein LZ30DRAFT_357896 [Colletotrichum cereale]|nr:hypothetical protein LZ30DRAFT_357896 [Colletotrichum cereale]